MTPIFICYRRNDTSGHVGHLRDGLLQLFRSNEIFIDVHNIEGGADFFDAIKKTIMSSQVVLIAIGKR